MTKPRYINRRHFKSLSWKPGRCFFHFAWDSRDGLEIRMWRKRKR